MHNTMHGGMLGQFWFAGCARVLCSRRVHSVAACRKYTVEEFERFANAFARKQFGTTAVMPPRMVEVRGCECLMCMWYGLLFCMQL
jgi:hypothetical protein